MIDSNTSDVPIRRAREILSLPVYSIAEGKALGSIDRLFVDLAARSVPLIRVGKSLSTWHAFVPFSAVRRLGEDIALVDSETQLRDKMTEEESKGLETNLAGRPIVTQTGERIGELIGFGVEEGSGRITFLRVQPDSSFLSRLASIGDHTIEVPDTMVSAFGPDTIIVHDAVKNLKH